MTRIFVLAALTAGLLQAQGSYEIQVYGSDLVAPGATMIRRFVYRLMSATTARNDSLR